MGNSGIRFLLINFFLVIMTGKKAAKKKKWPRKILGQASRPKDLARPFFVSRTTD